MKCSMFSFHGREMWTSLVFCSIFDPVMLFLKILETIVRYSYIRIRSFFFFFLFNDDSKFLVYFIKCRKLDGLFLVWITILLTSIIFLFAIFLKMVNNLEHEYSISLGLMECLKVPVYIRDSERLWGSKFRSCCQHFSCLNQEIPL